MRSMCTSGPDLWELSFPIRSIPEDTDSKDGTYKMQSLRQCTVITQPITGLNWKQAARISSLEKKPENGQIPEMAKTSNQECPVSDGHVLRNPPIASFR